MVPKIKSELDELWEEEYTLLSHINNDKKKEKLCGMLEG